MGRRSRVFFLAGARTAEDLQIKRLAVGALCGPFDVMNLGDKIGQTWNLVIPVQHVCGACKLLNQRLKPVLCVLICKVPAVIERRRCFG